MNKTVEKVLTILPDKTFIRLKYWYHFRKLPDLNNPRTFNEKIQWLKLYDRKPIYSKMVDKYEAKSYIEAIIGKEYIIPSFGVWESFEDIPFDNLPEQFVLKTTHDCGGVVICKKKNEFNKEKAKRFLKSHLERNYYYEGREWPYKNVQPRILAEAYMENTASSDLKDYKFFCFDGVVKALFIAADRQSLEEETKFDFYDENFNHLDIRNGHPNSKVEVEKPQNFELMKELASKLSKGFPHLRVDFYEVDGNVYVGELTFSHFSGMIPFEPEKWDYIFGEWIQLPKDKIIGDNHGCISNN